MREEMTLGAEGGTGNEASGESGAGGGDEEAISSCGGPGYNDFSGRSLFNALSDCIFWQNSVGEAREGLDSLIDLYCGVGKWYKGETGRSI